jgi:hypothetical protein
MAGVKKGPGVFVYDGTQQDTEAVPTPLLKGRNVPVLDGDGVPVVDGAGRQLFERAGDIVRDEKGRPVMGGKPKATKTAMSTLVLWGVEFPAGKTIEVPDAALALKLRCHPCFKELEAVELIECDVDAAQLEALGKLEPKKRGRPRKTDTE